MLERLGALAMRARLPDLRQIVFVSARGLRDYDRDTLHALSARRASMAANQSRKKKSVNFGAKKPSQEASEGVDRQSTVRLSVRLSVMLTLYSTDATKS